MSYRGHDGYIGEYKGLSVYGVSLSQFCEMIQNNDGRLDRSNIMLYINDSGDDFVIHKRHVIGTLTDHVNRFDEPVHISKFYVFRKEEEKKVKVATPKEIGIDSEAAKPKEVKVEKTEVDFKLAAEESIDTDFDFSIYTKVVDNFFQELKEKEAV